MLMKFQFESYNGQKMELNCSSRKPAQFNDNYIHNIINI